jgi:hypothetical protein
MSLNYTSYVVSLGNILVVSTTDIGFTTVLPNIIDDAEQRLYRDLQLLNTVAKDTSTAFVTGQRDFNLPSSNGTFLVVDSIYAITPAGTVNPNLGTRNYLLPASRSFIDALYPSSSGSGVPQYFAPTTQTTYVIGPWPDQAYQAEVVGTYRPQPISTTNVTTLLSVYFPDCFLAASLVFAAGYQQNFNAQGLVDNPQFAVTWESHLSTLMKSAETEEQMKKFNGPAWSSKAAAPLATPPRT